MHFVKLVNKIQSDKLEIIPTQGNHIIKINNLIVEVSRVKLRYADKIYVDIPSEKLAKLIIDNVEIKSEEDLKYIRKSNTNVEIQGYVNFIQIQYKSKRTFYIYEDLESGEIILSDEEVM